MFLRNSIMSSRRPTASLPMALTRPRACSNSLVCHGYCFESGQNVCRTCSDVGVGECNFVVCREVRCPSCADTTQPKCVCPGNADDPPLCVCCARSMVVSGSPPTARYFAKQ